MDIAEQRRRLKEEAVKREAGLNPPESKSNCVPQDPHLPLLPAAHAFPVRPTKENVKVMRDKSSILVIDLTVFLVFVLSFMTFFLLPFIKFPGSWVNIAAAKLNGVVLYGSSFVLKIIQGSCFIMGSVLNTYYYKISLQGDRVAFYSLELFMVYAVLFFSKDNMDKAGRVPYFLNFIGYSQ